MCVISNAYPYATAVQFGNQLSVVQNDRNLPNIRITKIGFGYLNLSLHFGRWLYLNGRLVLNVSYQAVSLNLPNSALGRLCELTKQSRPSAIGLQHA